MNGRPKVFAKGTVVYWVNYHWFKNRKDKRDGRDKAEEYCLDNFLDTNSIIKFDSETETRYYEYLLSLQKEGKISNLGHHFTLKVQDEFTNANGDTIPAITYEADFIYKDEVSGKRVVVDVKGSAYFIDDAFIRLKCMFDKAYLPKDLYIKVVMPKGKDEWVEWHIGEIKKSRKLINKQRDEIKRLREEAHRVEIENRTIEKEKATIIKYREWNENGHGLTKEQRLKLQALEEKYKV